MQSSFESEGETDHLRASGSPEKAMVAAMVVDIAGMVWSRGLGSCARMMTEDEGAGEGYL